MKFIIIRIRFGDIREDFMYYMGICLGLALILLTMPYLAARCLLGGGFKGVVIANKLSILCVLGLVNFIVIILLKVGMDASVVSYPLVDYGVGGVGMMVYPVIMWTDKAILMLPLVCALVCSIFSMYRKSGFFKWFFVGLTLNLTGLYIYRCWRINTRIEPSLIESNRAGLD